MATRAQWQQARINPPQATRGLFGVDKRIKLTDDDRARIQALNAQGVPVREIARQFEGVCSRRAIQFIIHPERAAIVKAQYKERRKDGRYYNKEKHTQHVRNYRAHLQEVDPSLSE